MSVLAFPDPMQSPVKEYLDRHRTYLKAMLTTQFNGKKIELIFIPTEQYGLGFECPLSSTLVNCFRKMRKDAPVTPPLLEWSFIDFVELWL
jgi:hypothetical protein